MPLGHREDVALRGVARGGEAIGQQDHAVLVIERRRVADQLEALIEAAVDIGPAGRLAFALAFVWLAVGAAILPIRLGRFVPASGTIARVALVALFSGTVAVYAAVHGVHGLTVGELEGVTTVAIVTSTGDVVLQPIKGGAEVALGYTDATAVAIDRTSKQNSRSEVLVVGRDVGIFPGRCPRAVLSPPFRRAWESMTHSLGFWW